MFNTVELVSSNVVPYHSSTAKQVNVGPACSRAKIYAARISRGSSIYLIDICCPRPTPAENLPLLLLLSIDGTTDTFN